MSLDQHAWLGTPIPDMFAHQREQDGTTIHIVSLTHTLAAADVDPDTKLLRVFADHIQIPAEGVAHPGISAVFRSRLAGTAEPSGIMAFPSSPYTITPANLPLQPLIDPPTNPAAGGTGQAGNPNPATGGDCGPLQWTNFSTVNQYIINANGGQGQQGQDGQAGGQGSTGSPGKSGYTAQHEDHGPPTHCVSGGPGGTGGTGGTGGAAGPGGTGGKGGSVSVVCTGPTDPDNVVVNVNGGLPGDVAPQRVALPGGAGSPGRGGPGAALLSLQTIRVNSHLSRRECRPTGAKAPNGKPGDPGQAGATATRANAGSPGSQSVTNGNSLSAVHTNDPYVFAQHQLSFRDAIRRHGTGDGATARTMTTWLRLATPSSARPSSDDFGRHWDALHTRLTLLARRIDRGADPFTSSAQPPRTLTAEAANESFSALLAAGTELQNAFVTFTRHIAGLTNETKPTVVDLLDHARRVSRAFATIAAGHSAALESAKASTHPETLAVLANSIRFTGADTSDSVAETRARLEEIFAVKDFPSEAGELLDAIEEQAWFQACADGIEAQLAYFAGAGAGYARLDSIPFRTFLFALYEDARQLCLRYAVFHGQLSGKPLPRYPSDLAELALLVDFVHNT